MKQRRKTELVLNKKPQLKALKKAIYIEVSKYILDLSKLVFGGVILTMIINADINKIITFVLGCMSLTILTTVGFVLYKKGKE